MPCGDIVGDASGKNSVSGRIRQRVMRDRKLMVRTSDNLPDVNNGDLLRPQANRAAVLDVFCGR